MRRTGTILAVALLLAWPSGDAAARGQASVDVSVDRRSLSLDEDLRAEITLSGDFDRYGQPALDGFEILGRQESQQIRIVGGDLSRKKVLTLTLRPRRAGELKIGAVELHRDGRVVARSEPVSIRVREPAVPPPTSADEARDLTSKARQDLFLHAETPRDRYYVGEPFVTSWRLYFRPQVQVKSAELVSSPKLEGLLAEELMDPDQRPRIREDRIGSRSFRWVPRSIQLMTGLEPGRIVVDPMAVRVSVGSFVRQARQVVRSQPFELEILPLPEQGRPAIFREGNIGKLDMSVSLTDGAGGQPGTVETGERLMLEVAVSGTGAMVSLKPPVLEDADRFEIQPLASRSEDRIEKDDGGMHGRRVFQFILVPREPGEYAPPKVRFAYFDPEAEGYETLSWSGLPLVVEGTALADDAATTALGGGDIGPAIDRHRLEHAGGRRLAGTPLFWGLLGLPLLAWLGVEMRHRVRARWARDPLARRAKGARGNARKRLRVADQLASDGLVKDFYGQLNRVLTGYFEERANLPATGMTHDELRDAGVEAGYPRELMDEIVVEMENGDFARFAPAASAREQMREALERVRALLARLDKVRPRRRP